MIPRFVPLALATAVIAASLVGCRPVAAPAPEPTAGFATEAEAFAAAEETYRAYVDALNEVDLSDPDTFEAVYAWTTGEANAEARETFTQMHADGWIVSGESVPTAVQPRLIGGESLTSAEVAVCLDVSEVQLSDSAGESMVASDRPDVQSMLIALESSPRTTTGWAINRFSGRDGQPECD